MPTKALALLPLIFVGIVSGFQFDTAKDPGYPVILPPPKSIEYGNETIVIDPCFLTIQTNVSSKLVPAEDLPIQAISENI